MKLYIIEDSLPIQSRLIDLLEGVNGIKEIYVSECSQDVEKKIGEINPDIVIVDIRLKNGSGFYVLEFLKKFYPVDLVIVITNYATGAYKRKAMALGADHFFNKTTEFNRVVDVVKEFSAGKKS